jgi:hypothetical protein
MSEEVKVTTTENEDDICVPLPEILGNLEKNYGDDKSLDLKLVNALFDELRKYQNGQTAVQEFMWLFGMGEESVHMVDSKECRKVFLVNFKTCAKYLQTFLLEAIKLE